MPTADDPRPRPSDEPEPAGGDPFEGLVLDERFVRDAAVKEPAARTRMLAARWKLEEPVDPGGRRRSPTPSGSALSRRARSRRRYLLPAAICAVVAFAAFAVGPGDALRFGDASDGRSSRSDTTGSNATADVALPGGGISDGGECGARGFHHFTLPASPAARDRQPGPQLALGAHGFMKASAADPGHFTIGLLLAPGRLGSMDLLPPLGPQGVAVEIEGPDGLVGGAHNLPVTFDDTVPRTADGRIRVGPEEGATATVTLPVEALCPGFYGLAVQSRLSPPIDSHNTITGQPPYTLTVSVSDPAIGALRQASGSTPAGDVLSTDNLIPHDMPHDAAV